MKPLYFSHTLVTLTLTVLFSSAAAENISDKKQETLLPDSALIRQTLTQLPGMRASRSGETGDYRSFAHPQDARTYRHLWR